VDHYGSCNCDLQHNQENVNGLLSQLVTGNGFFRAGVNFNESSVYDTDFYDGDVSGVTGHDQLWFDKAYNYSSDRGNGIAMYSGHGDCADVSTFLCVPGGTPCSSVPPYGTSMSLPVACLPNFPGATRGKCAYTLDRSAYVNPDVSSNVYGGAVDYSGGSVKLGERSPWGFGANGSTNFVIMDVSCAVRHHALWQELGPAFAGLHTFATIFMTSPASDVADVSDRGSSFGKQYAANPSTSIAHAWTIALNSVTSAGTHGINGYGAHSAVSAGHTSSESYYFRDQEDFLTIRNETPATYPYGWWSDTWTCNYDCSTYPIP
jgi:hypothetical protein